MLSFGWLSEAYLIDCYWLISSRNWSYVIYFVPMRIWDLKIDRKCRMTLISSCIIPFSEHPPISAFFSSPFGQKFFYVFLFHQVVCNLQFGVCSLTVCVHLCVWFWLGHWGIFHDIVVTKCKFYLLKGLSHVTDSLRSIDQWCFDQA